MGSSGVCCICHLYARNGLRIICKTLPMRYTMLNLVVCEFCAEKQRQGGHLFVPLSVPVQEKLTMEVEITPFIERKKELFQ